MKDFDFDKAIASLLKMTATAQGDSGGAGVIRRFLLSLYNGDNLFSVKDMNRLDEGNYQACIDVMNLDRFGQHEIHSYIKNGSEIYSALWRMENPNKKRRARL